MKDFEYAAATSIDEAVSLLAARGERAKALAGGTDLIVQLREGLREADLVVDVKKIPELEKLELSPGKSFYLGAAVPSSRIYRDPAVLSAYSALTDSARIIGGWQIQNRASIGGNLCNASPAADSIPSLIVLQAVCQIAGPSGRRSLPVTEFCTAPGKTSLQRGEFLVGLEFPAAAKKSGSKYLRFIPRNEMDIAVVGVAAWVRMSADGKTIEEARIALGAVAPTPQFAEEAGKSLAGKAASRENFVAAGELARKIAKPISDMRAPADYRRHLVGILTVRALEGAVERALQS